MTRRWAYIFALFALAFAVGCDRHARAESNNAAPEGASTDHYLAPKATGGVITAAATPAPKPTGPLKAGASCVTSECHAGMATARYIHGPVSKQACDACHGADSGTHQFPLKREKAQTCTFCHAVSGTAAHQHKALEQGCVACHRPHESSTKYLLKSPTVEALCSRCHEVPLKRFSHTPFAKGECTTCHQPHQSDGPHLMRAAGDTAQCLTCHQDMKQRMAAAGTHVHKPVAEACTNCHTPHASEFAMQLKAPIKDTCLRCHEDIKKAAATVTVAHAAMSEEKQCVNCHDPHTSGQSHMLKARADQVCLSCHNKPVKASDGRMIADMTPALTAKSLHGPVRDANCSACHEVHGGHNPGLLVKAFPRSFYASFDLKNYELCFSCHEKELVLDARTATLTNFRNGDQNLHFVHVNREEKGRTCKTCHEVHGSDLPRHMASGVPMGQNNWPMPIEYEQTPQGGRCAPGCHTPREYNRVKAVGNAATTTRPVATGGGVP